MTTQVADAGAGRRVGWTLALCFAAVMCEGFDIQGMGLAAPRLGPALGIARDQLGPLFSASIVGLLIGAVVFGRIADSWGRKPLFLAGFIVLPIRAVLYTLSDNSAWLIGVQVLDGVGAGIFGALTPLVIADIMRGTGRYNLAQGAVATAQGIGASLSGLIAGVLVDHAGYGATFLALGAVAAVAATVFGLGMPETADREGEAAPQQRAAGQIRPA